MSADDDQWYYDVSTKQVGQGKFTDSIHRMGPYPDKASAEAALAKVAERNAAADAQDEW